MEVKVFYTLFLGLCVCREKLIPGNAVLCFNRVTDNGVSGPLLSRIESERNSVGKRTTCPLNSFYMGYIVQIQHSTKIVSYLELFVWSIVTGEHNVLALDSCFLGHI